MLKYFRKKYRNITIQADLLFNKNRDINSTFNDNIVKLKYFEARKKINSNIDVIIASYGEYALALDVIRNFKKLEAKQKMSFWIIDTSKSSPSKKQVENNDDVNFISIRNNIFCIDSKSGNRFSASNGAALSAQLGFYFGQSRYAFFTHTDMMGYKINFLTYLLKKINSNTPIASFQNRGAFPFSAGAIYDKYYFKNSTVDWLPLKHNIFNFSFPDILKNKLKSIDWIDTGEQFVYDALLDNKTVFICNSKGLSKKGFLSDQIEMIGLDIDEYMKLQKSVNIDKVEVDEQLFYNRYPELTDEKEKRGWAKSFDDNGDVIFLHAGRGSKWENVGRGNFRKFLSIYNDKKN